MIRIIRIEKGDGRSISKVLAERDTDNYKEIDRVVEEILNSVKEKGDAALFAYTKKFDGADYVSGNADVKVTVKEMEAAYHAIDKESVAALEKAAENIERFHEKQLEKTWTYEEDGAILGQHVTPMDSVGVYVPGGKAAYPSTVLMDVIPAKIAGVKRIVMVSPPEKDGSMNPYILASAKIAGVTDFYKIGGAQAVAALAYGTESISPVVKITGPGNAYVARAKKMVFGTVDIDMIAGPSEVCIIADENNEVNYVAADLLSQAEHDEMASSILVTTSQVFAEKVREEIEVQLKLLPREAIARESIDNNGMIIVADNIEDCFDISNEIAPEHLEILLENPMDYLDKIRNAGAIFLGKYSPEPLGDYFAGPNHTLPTNGTAKYSSPLGVYSYMKKSSIICYTKNLLEKNKDTIEKIADIEGLTAHGRAISIRFDK